MDWWESFGTSAEKIRKGFRQGLRSREVWQVLGIVKHTCGPNKLRGNPRLISKNRATIVAGRKKSADEQTAFKENARDPFLRVSLVTWFLRRRTSVLLETWKIRNSKMLLVPVTRDHLKLSVDKILLIITRSYKLLHVVTDSNCISIII